jgi:all-trans-retinol 13,14-reductase
MAENSPPRSPKRRNKMKNKFDVIIIGAGISGLMAGALLAKKGKRVLILESQPKIGGYLSGFERKGYYFDVGITRSNISYVEPHLREAGVLDDVHFVKIDGDYHVNGRYIPYNNLQEYFAGVADAFPEQKAGILSFYGKEVAPREKKMKTMMYSDFKSMGKFQKYFTIMKIFAMMPGMMRENSSKENENDVLRKYVDEKSEAFAFLCTRPDQVDYRGHMTMSTYVGKILSQLYNYYPREGYLYLCNLLRKVITEHGAELMMNSRALKIKIENNVAISVEYQIKNKQVETASGKNIVSATDLNKTFHELIGADIVPPAEMRKLKGSVLGSSVPILFLGVRIPSQRVRQLFNGKEELCYFPAVKKLNADPNDIDFFVNCNMVIHASSLVNSDHAPQGCSNIQIYLSCPPVGWQQDWGLVNGERTERYEELKKKVIGDVLSSLESLIPELKDRSVIEVCELGTPHTDERYTGNTHGVALGFNFDGYLLSAPRIRSYYSRLSNVSNLFFIGHQTGYGGGLNVALGSAKKIANELCQ